MIFFFFFVCVVFLVVLLRWVFIILLNIDVMGRQEIEMKSGRDFGGSDVSGPISKEKGWAWRFWDEREESEFASMWDFWGNEVFLALGKIYPLLGICTFSLTVYFSKTLEFIFSNCSFLCCFYLFIYLFFRNCFPFCCSLQP